MNKVMLLGRLTKTPQLKFTQINNKAYITFSIAVDRKYENENETDFFNVIAFGKTAEFISTYFFKGKKILVSGRLENQNYQDELGQNQSITRIIAEEVDFADDKKAPEMNNYDDDMITFSGDDLPF